MDDIFESLPNLFVDKMQKMMKLHARIMAEFLQVNVWNKENQKSN